MTDPFPQTRWSLVVEAQRDEDTLDARRALDELCRTYWYPIYGYARRRGLNPHDAEDRTQGFFELLLERGSFLDLSPERGRMRSFLLTGMKRYLANEWRNANAEKRGGGRSILSIDRDEAESRLAREISSDEVTPEQSFDRQWAHAVLDAVYARLEASFTESGQERVFAGLRRYLAGNDDGRPQAEVARELGMAEATVRTTIHRMRTKFRNYLHTEIRETVASAEEAEEELRHLKQILASR